jgi:hypothetical protein
MSSDNKLKNFLKDFDESIVPADGLDYAFYGVAKTETGYQAIYSTERIIAHLMEEDMMDFDAAEEFMHKNIFDAYQGENPPIFMDIIPEEFWK